MVVLFLFLEFSLRKLGKITILTDIFSIWVEPPTRLPSLNCFFDFDTTAGAEQFFFSGHLVDKQAHAEVTLVMLT